MNGQTKTYMIFTTNCIRNETMAGDFTFYNRYHYPKMTHVPAILDFSEHQPAFRFENIIATGKDFNVRRYFQKVCAEDVILTLVDDGDEYEIMITYHDPNSNTKWTTEPLSDQEPWGLTKKQISYVMATLIRFYEEYQNARKERRLNIAQLQKTLLTDCNI